jgi:membrane protease YdiL (CAAX protease family)
VGIRAGLPAALLNVLGGNPSDPWVRQWWHPLAAFAPGIAEEIAARLFLTTLCYALLRPTTNDHPRRAVLAAILIGAIVHSLAHLPTLEIVSGHGVTFLIAGLLYGVPMALLFIKRDLEQAIGYHFFVDFVRFLVAFLYV